MNVPSLVHRYVDLDMPLALRQIQTRFTYLVITVLTKG